MGEGLLGIKNGLELLAARGETVREIQNINYALFVDVYEHHVTCAVA